MAKRRTRRDKINSEEKRSGFKIDFSAIEQGNWSQNKSVEQKNQDNTIRFLRHDLTKLLLIFMLAVGSELALWWFVF